MNGEEKPPAQRPAAEDSTVSCPRCNSGRARQAAPYGIFLFTARYRCPACGAEFERIRLQPPARQAAGKDGA